ncbi:MAG: hypothetical protein SOI66_06310 [Bifidobacterium sp.]|jgi:hypothetical protein
MRGVIAPVFGLLAVASVILGMLNATIWKPNRNITATTSVSGTRYVVSDHGVLSSVDDDVRLVVSSPGASEDVCVAVGSTKDVTGWVSGHAYTRITGLNDWTTLSSRHVKAQSVEGNSDPVAFKDSDMWQTVKCGKTRVSLDITNGNPEQVAIADLGDHAASATVTMHWNRHTVPDFATPLYFVGGLLALLTVLFASIFAMPQEKRRKRMVSSAPVEAATEIAVSEAFAGSFAGIKSAISIKPRGNRRRHAAHGQNGRQDEPFDDSRNAATDVPAETGSPAIIDPMSRNMLANSPAGERRTASEGPLQTSAGASGSGVPGRPGDAVTGGVAGSSAPVREMDDEPTSVITNAELQAYFARFTEETGGEDADGSGAQAETGSTSKAGDENDRDAGPSNGLRDDPRDAPRDDAQKGSRKDARRNGSQDRAAGEESDALTQRHLSGGDDGAHSHGRHGRHGRRDAGSPSMGESGQETR